MFLTTQASFQVGEPVLQTNHSVYKFGLKQHSDSQRSTKYFADIKTISKFSLFTLNLCYIWEYTWHTTKPKLALAVNYSKTVLLILI